MQILQLRFAPFRMTAFDRMSFAWDVVLTEFMGEGIAPYKRACMLILLV